MAEWFKRSTVNTFYRGSIPLKALLKIITYFFILMQSIVRRRRATASRVWGWYERAPPHHEDLITQQD